MSAVFLPGLNANLRTSAQAAVTKAIKNGQLVRPERCEGCGEIPVGSATRSPIVAHHDDYASPLAVSWLCVQCHQIWHYGSKFGRKEIVIRISPRSHAALIAEAKRCNLSLSRTAGLMIDAAMESA